MCSIAQEKSKSKWWIQVGAGPSYSIFFAQGGWSRSFGSININNETNPRTTYALSHFGEVEWNIKGGRWSAVVGYSTHDFFPNFEAKGYTFQGTYYFVNTKEYDKNTYLQITAKYRLVDNRKSKMDIGTGVYNRFNRRQRIEYTPYFDGSQPRGYTLSIIDGGVQRTNVEGGLPINIDYLRMLFEGKSAIGLRLNVNYTQSLRQWEHMAAQIFLKIRLK